MGRIEKFTEGARATLRFARDEALLLQHDHIGTEHLVLGLLRVPDDPAAMVLAELGVGLPAARATVENAVGKGVGPVLGQIEATAALRTLLGVATREAEDCSMPSPLTRTRRPARYSTSWASRAPPSSPGCRRCSMSRATRRRTTRPERG
jgi:hypothetical protein